MNISKIPIPTGALFGWSCSENVEILVFAK